MDDVLAAWGRHVVVGRLGGGNRNAVTEIRLAGQRLVARRSARPPASLDWEAALLDHLAGHGLRVPVAVPALDGRRHVGGVMVLTWLPGQQPGAGDWPARLDASRRAVIHGDPGPANIRITSAGAGLLDWDEARVDCTDLDLADLPGRHLPPGRLIIARTAVTAWEAASGWVAEPSYARRQLRKLKGLAPEL